MGRQRARACLEQGLRLDINFLARTKIVQFGDLTINRSIRWSDSSGDVAIGAVSADLIGHTGWLGIEIDGNTQRIEVISEGRHLGGHQRYFICPTTGEKASVLWRPSGAEEFRSRLGWGRSVAYITQIGTWVDRAHRGKEKVNLRMGNGDRDTGKMPRKPKWMRMKTYQKYARRFDHYESALAQGPNGRELMSRPA